MSICPVTKCPVPISLGIFKTCMIKFSAANILGCYAGVDLEQNFFGGCKIFQGGAIFFGVCQNLIIVLNVNKKIYKKFGGGAGIFFGVPEFF